jgi:hypothetical protein
VTKQDTGESGSRRDAARRATNTRAVRSLARIGLIASGVVHILIGVIAINVTSGLGGHADQFGALSAVAAVPGGPLVLWAAAIALIGLALWQWTGPMAWRPSTAIPRRVRDRAKALGFLAVGLASLVFAIGGRSDASTAPHHVSAWLLNLPGGVFVLLGIGVVVGTVGGAFVFRGVSRNFREDIERPKGICGTAVITLGVFGHVTKGLALLLVGALFAGSAAFSDANWATGIDGAVRYLDALPTGAWPLLVIALGLMSHGLYLAARAVYMRR